MTSLNKKSCKLQTDGLRTNSKAAGNSTYKKLAVQWLNEALPLRRDRLCFVSMSVAIGIVVKVPPFGKLPKQYERPYNTTVQL
ncbi:hypothetical protein BH11BAC2_BH11BAC2_09550 [soil metagenome]